MDLKLFEEDLSNLSQLTPRWKACQRQCRVLRHKLDGSLEGGCSCDGPSDCIFQPQHELKYVNFPDVAQYYNDLFWE